MSRLAFQWSIEELTADADKAMAAFREERLNEGDVWTKHYRQSRAKFERLFDKLSELNPQALTDEKLAEVHRMGLGEALRYLAGPPFSEDDLSVISDVDSVSSKAFKENPEALRKVFSVVARVLDPYRFPWVASGAAPTEQQREAALLASSVLLAAQRMATARRNEAKEKQESKVKDYLRTLGFGEVKSATITALGKGPQELQFCGECRLGVRKADVVARLHDGRLLPIECKVSNSVVNSVKRVNNDAAAKSEYWRDAFGKTQVIPTAVLSGVFNVMNLEQVQNRGLTLIWAHDLDKLGALIESTRCAGRTK